MAVLPAIAAKALLQTTTRAVGSTTAVVAQKAVQQAAPKLPGVVGMAPAKPVTALEAKNLDVALSGIASSLGAAARRGLAQVTSAIRQATQQLQRLDPGQIAGLPPEQRAVLDVKLGEAFHQLPAASREGVPFQQLAGQAAEKLGEVALSNLGGPGSVEARGPGLSAPLSAKHLERVRLTAQDPLQNKVLSEVLAANPHAPSVVLDLIESSPMRDKILPKLATMYPGVADPAAARLALSNDVGPLEKQLDDAMTKRGLSPEDRRVFFDVLAETRSAFAAGATGDDMQRTNWIHTRIELLHTLEAGHRLGLDPLETKAALYGALFSDAFKDAGPYSVAWHNRPGAELVAPLVMSRHLDLSSEENQKLLAWTMRVAHEHQITPPMFMSGALGAIADAHVKKTRPDDPSATALVQEIKDRTLKPLDQPQIQGEIVFSKGASQLLQEIGVPGWAVTHDAPWARASQAAILGDVWQYASPDGLIKYGHDLRDPGHPVPMFRDPVISMDHLASAHADAAAKLKAGKTSGGAIESALDFSLGEGMKVIVDPKLRAILEDAQADMRQVLATRVYPEVDSRLRAKLGDGPIPYWTQPLDVSKPLSESERAAATLVKKTFEAVMAEVGGVPLDPFGTRGVK